MAEYEYLSDQAEDSSEYVYAVFLCSTKWVMREERAEWVRHVIAALRFCRFTAQLSRDSSGKLSFTRQYVGLVEQRAIAARNNQNTISSQ